MEPSLTSQVLEDFAERMGKAVEHTRAELSTVRSGRAVPGLIEPLKVDYYGADVPLLQLASITAPDARLLVISPFDKGAIRSIEKAIQGSDLGITPSNDGQVIRLAFPQLSAERRKELVKVVRQRAEEGRVAVRNLRRQARHDLEGWAKEGEISNDDMERAERALDKLTQDHVAEVDRVLSHKEQELMEI